MDVDSIFHDKDVLTNAEVANILGQYEKANKAKNPQFQMNPILKKTYDYVRRFSFIRNATALEEIRRKLEDQGLNKVEIGAIANLLPENAEEALTLVPSLKDEDKPEEERRFPTEEDIDNILMDLAQYKDQAA